LLSSGGSARENTEHNLIVERNDIEILEIARPMTEEYGSDLALIILTNWKTVATIKATNTFYNLMHDRERMLSEPPANIMEKIAYEEMVSSSSLGFFVFINITKNILLAANSH